MTNMLTHKNRIIDEVNVHRTNNRKVIDIRLEEPRRGVTLRFETDPDQFLTVDARDELERTCLRNEAAAYFEAINNPRRR